MLPNRFPAQRENVFPANRVAGIDSTCCVNHRRGPETAALGAIWRGRGGGTARWKRVRADITLCVCMCVEILLASTFYLEKKEKNPDFFPSSSPGAVCSLQRYRCRAPPPFPCIFDCRHACQSAHVEGGETLWASLSTGGKLDRLVLKCSSSSARLPKSLHVSVGTGSVEVSDGSQGAFNDTPSCRIDSAAELRSDY